MKIMVYLTKISIYQLFKGNKKEVYMKKYISFLLAFTIVFSCFSVYAQEIKPANVKVLLNEQELTFEQAPVIVNDRTLVPLRAIFESLGAEVEWDGETRTVTATRDNDIIKLTIDDLVAYKNDDSITLDAPPIIVEGHTMVPARFIAESFGLEVGWDGDSRIITIEKIDKTITPIEPVQSVDPYIEPVEENSVPTEAIANQVNINSATIEELKNIIHINDERAQEIISLRQNSEFNSVEDLTRVNGIGSARVKDILEQDIATVE